MSNIFQALVRRTEGALPLNLGTSQVPVRIPPTKDHLMFDRVGNIFAEMDGVIDHYGAALPFAASGRLIVSLDPVDRFDQGIPFTANGAVALGDFAAPFVFDIIRTAGGTCTFPAAGACVAQSTYTAIVSSAGAPTGVWAVDNGAVIVDGQGTLNLVVDGPSGDVDVTYNVMLTVTNANGMGSKTVAFTDTKTLIVLYLTRAFSPRTTLTSDGISVSGILTCGMRYRPFNDH